ncbi:EmrB/QacA subfamily drug resistance transporter [Luteibacter sp. Sphag1AF]|uniref:MFS transporter n=1 Tax=Luteibacter sp. Sphag1AF TaxID=2587031 RepID=UPI001612A491|nr:MFS transporter [Luteibacter sp. Sphag1AF]MBB3228670.1 EmrB/QacA subfamily drug resistance transporter [Luteibacter sp. Sphag1AF]
MHTHADSPSRHPRNGIALAAVCLAALMFGVEISSVPVILPMLESLLHSNFKDVQWIMNAYTIATTAVLMATGTLADRFGRKRVFMVAIVLFAISSLSCGLAWSTAVLIVSRAFQGASGGAMLICLVAILSNQFPSGAPRSRAFGMWGIIFGVGLGFGPLIGGLIVAVADWRWVFWIHVVVAMFAFGFAYVGVEESRDPQAKKLDVAGTVSLSLAVLGLAWFITQGADTGFAASTLSSAVLVASAASFIVFVRVELRHTHPMFDFSVFRIRNFSGAIFGSMGMNFSFWPFIIYLPIYFQSALGYGAVAAGVSLLAYTLPTLVFPPIGERLALRYGPGRVIPGGLFTIGLGFFLMKIGSSVEHASWLTVLPGCVLAGAGLGMTNTPVTNTTTGSVSAARAGMASGIDMSARMISLAINIALMGFVLLEGVLHHLKGALAGPDDDASWRALASGMVSGHLTLAEPATWGAWSPQTWTALAREALVNGFGWIMLYGGVAAWLLAGASFLAFADGKRALVSDEAG